MRFAPLSIVFLVVSAAAYASDFEPFPGTHIDDERVLRVSDRGIGPARPPVDRESLAYVSLPKLFQSVRERIEAGQPLTDAQRYLNGMVKLEYLFLFPEENDIVIAGPREPIDKSNRLRPVGKVSGRPVLHLDDLVVALRRAGPVSEKTYYGCSLDFPRFGVRKVQWAARKVGTVKRSEISSVLDELIALLGYQDIRYINMDPDTRSALAMIEADYILKMIAMNRKQVSVPEVERHQKMLAPQMVLQNRWWFMPSYEPLATNEEQTAFQFRGPSLAVHASNSPFGNSTGAAVDPSTRAFADDVTTHLTDLAAEIPAFADLQNLADLGLVAALIKEDGLAERANWDHSWADEDYPLKRYRAPEYAETLGQMNEVDCVLQIALGGIELTYGKVVAPTHRRIDSSLPLAVLARRPTKGWALQVPSKSIVPVNVEANGESVLAPALTPK